MSHINLHESAPTQFQDVGDVRLAYRQFGKEGAPPLVCLQHFTGRMDNWDPIHTNKQRRRSPSFMDRGLASARRRKNRQP